MLEQIKVVARHYNGSTNHYTVSNVVSVEAARAFVREQVPTARVVLALVPKMVPPVTKEAA